MPQQIYPITDEWEAMGAVFREDFTSPDTCSKNGTILVGSPSVNRGITLNGTTQYATNPKRLSLNGQGFIVVRFTPNFAYDENTARVLIGSGSIATANSIYTYKHNNANFNRLLCYLGTGYVYCNGADYSAFWLIGEENVLVVSWNGTSSAMWLNGNALTVTDVAMALNNTSSLTFGAATGGTSLFSGSIQSLIIGNRPLTQGCEDRLITPEPLARIRTEASLVTIPGVQAYNRASDGLRVTPILGKIATQHGVTEAILGDGTTATTFPTLITPRGFSFDGGDYINLGDNDAFTFADGVGDKPFSVAVMCSISVAGGYEILGKLSVASQEWLVTTTADRRLILQISDNVAGGRKYYATVASIYVAGVPFVFVATYDGGGSGLRVYMNGTAILGAVFTVGSYVRMRASDAPVQIGSAIAGHTSIMPAGSYMPMMPQLFDVELSECEVRALTARMQRQARTR